MYTHICAIATTPMPIDSNANNTPHVSLNNMCVNIDIYIHICVQLHMYTYVAMQIFVQRMAPRLCCSVESSRALQHFSMRSFFCHVVFLFWSSLLCCPLTFFLILFPLCPHPHTRQYKNMNVHTKQIRRRSYHCCGDAMQTQQHK